MNDKIKTDWTINGLLAVILVLLVSNYVQSSTKTALAAGDGGGWGTNGIVIGTIAGQAERLVLVDTQKQNIMIYHSRQPGGLGLSGVRSYKYDVEMEDTTSGKLGANGITYWQAAVEYNRAHEGK